MNRSEARRQYWSNIPPEVRSEHARKAATIRHATMTDIEKDLLIKNLNEARRNKRNN